MSNLGKQFSKGLALMRAAIGTDNNYNIGRQAVAISQNIGIPIVSSVCMLSGLYIHFVSTILRSVDLKQMCLVQCIQSREYRIPQICEYLYLNVNIL